MDKDQYKQELLAAYEDEVSGKAYFESLAHYYREPEQQRKLIQVAKLEQQTAERLKPLLQRYELKPQSDQELHQQGKQEAQNDGKKNWRELLTFFKDDYTKYIDEFKVLESAGSEQDRPALRALTQHEIALVEFVTRELAGDANSLQSIEDQLTGC
ncbi:MAG: hypothetical protein V3U86_07625 [Acidobacteriota bacterium]